MSVNQDIYTRRSILAALSSTALLSPSVAQAAARCNLIAPNVQSCDIGIPFVAMDRIAQGSRQVMQNWCWAACISAIFRFHGHDVHQSRFVEKVYGGIVDQPARGVGIFNAVNGRWRDNQNNIFRAEAEVLLDRSIGYAHPNGVAIAVNDLANNYPLIVGSQGHATVLTHMSYLEDRFGQYEITGISVRDPWPQSPNLRSMSPQEYHNSVFLARIRTY